MQTVFVKLTAHRTKDGLETIKREVIGVSPEDAGEAWNGWPASW